MWICNFNQPCQKGRNSISFHKHGTLFELLKPIGKQHFNNDYFIEKLTLKSLIEVDLRYTDVYIFVKTILLIVIFLFSF